jgi:hypothetical protein
VIILREWTTPTRNRRRPSIRLSFFFYYIFLILLKAHFCRSSCSTGEWHDQRSFDSPIPAAAIKLWAPPRQQWYKKPKNGGGGEGYQRLATRVYLFMCTSIHYWYYYILLGLMGVCNVDVNFFQQKITNGVGREIDHTIVWCCCWPGPLDCHLRHRISYFLPRVKRSGEGQRELGEGEVPFVWK